MDFKLPLKEGCVKPSTMVLTLCLWASLTAVAAAQEITLPAVNRGPEQGPPARPHGLFDAIPYKGRATPEQLAAQSAAGQTIPLWSGTATSNGGAYTYQMVGTDPQKGGAGSQIKAVIVPIKVTFTNQSGTTVLAINDPTASSSKCSPAGTPLKLTLDLPLFKSIANFKAGGSTNIGTGQYVSLFQRANFWKYVSANPNYQVTLNPVVTGPTFSVTINGGPTPTATHCGGKLGYVEKNWWDSYVQNTLFPKLAGKGYGPTTLPIFLFSDVELYDTVISNGILGYHTAFDNPNFANAFQTYVVGEYDTSNVFSGDVDTLTHEIAEWMDDPAVDNPVPPWGHVGQVSGCQSNLEVGDPLSTTVEPISVGGFTYHAQDLAFLSWFFDQKPSIGVDGRYSLYGTLNAFAKACTKNTKLVGTGAVGAAAQGSSVALSGDGNTAILGGSSDASGAGATWVFTQDIESGVWTQQGIKLVGTGAVGAAAQGFSVALSADGNVAIVGGPYDNGGYHSVGAAWIFTRTADVWSQQAKLVGTGVVGSSATQGWSVALSSDGNTALVGGSSDNCNPAIACVGAAWIFTRSSGA